MHKFEKLNHLSINIYELNFCREQNKWKQKLIRIEISKNESHRVVDLITYKNHYVLFIKLNVFLGKQDCRYNYKRCLSSYTSENMIKKHKEQRIQREITSVKTSLESHVHWKNHFHKNPLYFRIYADFEADHEDEKSSVGNKTTNIYKQNPVCNGYRIVSELQDVLKSGYFKSPSG